MRNLVLYGLCYSQFLIQNSIVVTGTKKLFGDALVACQIILIPIVLAAFVWWQIQKNTCEENEESRFTKKQKTALVGLIVAELIGTLIGTIGGYYGLNLG